MQFSNIKTFVCLFSIGKWDVLLWDCSGWWVNPHGAKLNIHAFGRRSYSASEVRLITACFQLYLAHLCLRFSQNHCWESAARGPRWRWPSASRRLQGIWLAESAVIAADGPLLGTLVWGRHPGARVWKGTGTHLLIRTTIISHDCRPAANAKRAAQVDD